ADGRPQRRPRRPHPAAHDRPRLARSRDGRQGHRADGREGGVEKKTWMPGTGPDMTAERVFSYVSWPDLSRPSAFLFSVSSASAAWARTTSDESLHRV